MPRLHRQDYQDIERVIEFDFVRATEAAALNSLRWLGRGDKEAADAAACDAMRGMFDLMNICGEVVIGEGIKDEAPRIFKGEQLGTWIPGSPQFDIAIDPIDGTTNISKGAPTTISCMGTATSRRPSRRRCTTPMLIFVWGSVVPLKRCWRLPGSNVAAATCKAKCGHAMRRSEKN